MPSMATGASGSSGLSGLFLPPKNSPKKKSLGSPFLFLQRVGAAVSIPTIPEKAGRPTRGWGQVGTRGPSHLQFWISRLFQVIVIK
jgi:hypothetical protein